ncbi:hypothetical protein [Sphingobacterium multivorum]|uniref:hypothetical protein n=1 Tax=Sphingobacterium multivorum TaxID=28454 RepID=UPI003DA4966B
MADFQEEVERHALAEIKQEPDRFLGTSDLSRKKSLVPVELLLENEVYPGSKFFLYFVQFFLHNAKLHPCEGISVQNKRSLLRFYIFAITDIKAKNSFTPIQIPRNVVTGPVQAVRGQESAAGGLPKDLFLDFRLAH